MTGKKGLGKKKAIVAIARKLAELLYPLMKNGTEYEVRKFGGGTAGGWQGEKTLKKVANSLDKKHRRTRRTYGSRRTKEGRIGAYGIREP
jgi:hypothetical protein